MEWAADSRSRLFGEPGGGALGHLESGPDVHVDDDPDDLESLLRREVLGERVVPGTEIVGDGRIRDASDRLGVGEGGAGRVVVEVRLPPGGQSIDHWSGYAGVTRRLVVEVEALRAVVDLRHPQAQELGKSAVDA